MCAASRTIIHNDEAYAGALAVVYSIRAALSGNWSAGSDLIPLILEDLPDTSVRDRLQDFSSLSSEEPLAAIAARYGTGGFVVESVPFAILAAQRASARGYEDWLRDVISAGGDTDTIASIAGQIVGCSLGHRALPVPMQSQILGLDRVERTSREFARFIESRALSP